jgi:hypothetical protein
VPPCSFRTSASCLSGDSRECRPRSHPRLASSWSSPGATPSQPAVVAGGVSC